MRTMDVQTRMALTEALIPIVRNAGTAVLNIRDKGFETRFKEDASPVTEADLVSESIIVEGLSGLGISLPAISEEHVAAAGMSDAVPPVYFLLDPLDGTREFVTDRPEFTVNVAMVENSVPTMGIILAPASRRLFFAVGTGLAFEQMQDGRRRNLGPLNRATREMLIVLASRSHLDAATRALVKRLEPCILRRRGSSLKFVLIADGKADLYPRLAPTMAWDSAAGQVLVEAAGGVVVRPDGSRLTCPPAQGFRHEGFITARSAEVASASVRLLDCLRPAAGES
jgi:3'(2'), 5'-bisphosphate nucleotidase